MRSATRPGLCALLLMLILRSARALDVNASFQDYVLGNWNTEDGLPQVSVLSITQDGKGYLWVGTGAALTRFDGVRFTVFDRKATGGIDTSMVTSSLHDRRDRLWFGTPHGLLLYTDAHFRRISAVGATESISIQAMTETVDGQLLFATPQGVMRYQDDALVPALLPGQPSYSLLRSGDGLWLGLTGAVAHQVDGRMQTIALPAAASSARVTRLAQSAQGLWVGTNAGLFLWHDGNFERGTGDADLNRLAIESLYCDSDGNVWVSTAAVLYRIRPSGALERIDATQFLQDSWISSLFEDREHNLWLGSTTESLFQLHNGWIKHYNSREGLPDRLTWSVARDPHGDMVIGTNSGVALADAHGVHVLLPGKALPSPAAYELFYDRRQRLWIGTRSGVAIYADGKLDTPPALAALGAYQINAIVQVGDDDYWIGTLGGLYHYRDGVLRAVGAAPGSALAHVRCIYVVNPDEILIGTEGGLRRVRGESVDLPDYARVLEGVFVTTIAPLQHGLLGIGTLNAGIGLLADDRLTMLTSENGLPGNNAWNFRVIDGYVYAGSIDGAWRIALPKLAAAPGSATPTVQPELIVNAIVRERQGQRTRCCNGGANARSAVDGDKLWFPTMNGPIRIDTAAITAPQIAPTAVIEGIEHQGMWHEPQPELRLSGTPRDLEIRFTGLYFHDPRSLHFRYKLEGYDDDWIDAGSRRSAYYTHLGAGVYHFHLIATSGANRSSADTVVSFTLIPQWYERAAVQMFFVLLLLALLVLLWQARLRSFRRRQQELEVLVQHRTQQLRYANKQLAEANRTLTVESNTDPLTGLPNRRYLLQQIEQLIAAARGAGVRPRLALLLIDMDDFKGVNDASGHLIGDRILQQFGALLNSHGQRCDLLARWGGDEFLLVLRDTHAEQAIEFAERLRELIVAHAFLGNDGEVLRLKCSIGVSLHPPLPRDELVADWSVALELADMALNRIKQEGGNRSIALIAANHADSELFRRNISASLDRLLASGALRLLRGRR